MDSRIMIGQVPVIVGGQMNTEAFESSSSGAPSEQANQNIHQNNQPFGSSSFGPSNAQTSNSKEGEVPPTNVLSVASDDYESNENLELNSGAKSPDAGNHGGARRRNRYHRHTAHQIQEMEAFFKECPRPSEKERRELGRELGMEPLQVKLWFQNKRAKTKAQSEREGNNVLKAKNEMLRAENLRFRGALMRSACPSCGTPQAVPHLPLEASDLVIENAKLIEEIDKLQEKVRRAFGDAFDNSSTSIVPYQPVVAGVAAPDAGAFGGEEQPNVQDDGFHEVDLTTSVGGSNVLDKGMIVDLANAAMNELIRMTQENYPLWIPSTDQRHHMLNEEVYDNMFPRRDSFATPLSFRVEATRDSDVSMVNQMDLVDAMMNMEKFEALFSCILSRTALLDVIFTGNEARLDGLLVLVNVEYQVVTPIIPTRESTFARYCKKLENDTWAVVDFSTEDRHKTLTLKKCHRMPSGCVIQAIPDGRSRVTWIEHVELDNTGVHPIGQPFVDSGLAFGAQRWLAVLERQYERLATTNDFPCHVAYTNGPKGRKNILRLAERMAKTFYNVVTSSAAEHSLLTQDAIDGGEVKMATKVIKNELGEPFSSVLRATTSFWVPVQHGVVLRYFRDESTRKEWDALTRGERVQEFVNITNGHRVGNCVSMLRVTGTNTSRDMIILQECSTDSISSSIIYAPMDHPSVKTALSGGILDNVRLRPSGFTIYPSKTPPPPPRLTNDGTVSASLDAASSVGSLVTVAFQITLDPSTGAATSRSSSGYVPIIENLIARTVDGLKFFLLLRRFGDHNRQS